MFYSFIHLYCGHRSGPTDQPEARGLLWSRYDIQHEGETGARGLPPAESPTDLPGRGREADITPGYSQPYSMNKHSHSTSNYILYSWLSK